MLVEKREMIRIKFSRGSFIYHYIKFIVYDLGPHTSKRREDETPLLSLIEE